MSLVAVAVGVVSPPRCLLGPSSLGVFRARGVYVALWGRVFDTELGRIFDDKMNYGKKLEAKCFRVRNNNDAVTRVPFAHYRHVGTEIYFDR